MRVLVRVLGLVLGVEVLLEALKCGEEQSAEQSGLLHRWEVGGGETALLQSATSASDHSRRSIALKPTDISP